jgi:hypothetical protein
VISSLNHAHRMLWLTMVIVFLFFPQIETHGAVSEIRKDFLNNAALLPVSLIMSAPASDADYLICATAENLGGTVPTAVLRWTDENAQFRSFTFPQMNGVPNGCNLIRNQAETAASIETDGSYSGSYDLFVFGLGFWPDGKQAQGGLSEPVNYAESGLNAGWEFPFPGFPWIFAIISANNCKWQLSAGSAGTLSGYGAEVFTSYGTGSGVFTTQTSECSYSLIALQFGTPKSGSGPLTDYECDLLEWRDATYPKQETVFSSSSKGANILLASNIAEQGNNGIVSEELSATWSNQVSVPCAASLLAGPSGEPSSCVSPVFIGPLTALQVLTYNTPGQKWGTSPTYSAEVDVLQF